MRDAAIRDNWKEFYKFAPQVFPKKIELCNIVGVKDSTLEVDKPLTVICGHNGTGKTTVLRALYNAIAKTYQQELLDDIRLVNATHRVVVQERGAEKEYDQDQSSDLTTISTYFIDCCSLPPQLQAYFKKEDNLDELLDGYDESYIEDDRKLIGQTLFKLYDQIQVWEIEDFHGIENVPYFRVVLNGVEYGAENMGLGEYSVLFLYWKLKNADAHSFFFIEEPESHLSPASQLFLMDLIVKTVLASRSYLFLNTHSPALLNYVQDDYIKLAISGDGTELLNSEDFREGLFQLGLRSEVKRLLLVEDNAARYFLTAILDRFDNNEISSLSKILSCGGHSHITEMLNHYPHGAKSFSVFGIFDADVTEEQLPQIGGYHILLPGDADPEHIAQQAFHKRDVRDLFKLRMGLTDRQLTKLYGNNRSKDYHEWARCIAEELNVSKESILQQLFKIILELDGDIQRKSEAFVLKLREIIE